MKTKQFINDIYSTHKERIKANIQKFDVGEWNKHDYAKYYDCTLVHVETTINNVMMERLNKYKWENVNEGLPIDKHSFINIPDVKEIEPIRTIDHGDKIELIYSSKMNLE